MNKSSNQAIASRSKAVGYARVSTPEQAEKDLSLPAQMASIRRYAQDRGLALAGEFVERGVSGTDDNRPEFRRMLEEIYRPNSEVGMVIVTHGSRFMRNATRARVHKEQLRRHGIRVLAIQQTVSDDPNGHFAEGMFELIDQLESETMACARALGWPKTRARATSMARDRPSAFASRRLLHPPDRRTSSSSSRPKQGSCARSSVSTWRAAARSPPPAT